ncbi:MAG: c-type cytochrome [Planctomycetia bacterium]|nr:c-type cytochrome [Planctomycetia bacterium]
MRTLALLVLLAGPAFAQPLVAPTDAKTPEEERQSFKLPPGFTAQLVASEPDIQKPMQLAFDAKGRIWVTTSYHYPFAAEKGKASDKLFVLSDFDANGKARKVETFDDKLNIPIGILPLPDCKSCIVSSVGEILKLTDTDGDGKADQREVLFTGFGSRDTHGMYNSFTYMHDGWVYACHGFANDSKVKGKDGHEIQMNSGHTFRFRPDGSRIEVYTRGQVNPFGMTVDPWFNFYTADCHSKPITQLIKGAYYDSFGKPHDGLGYAPHVTQHQHGSTGLCGLAWYDADHFPKEWNGVMFLGNVVTSRINCDRIEWKGSTPVAKELPDFLVSDDPWFRPVDIKLGPDGALYVNDFYNKIIGHYEVDLKHPGRDKGRGRMWRIVYEGRPLSREAKPRATGPKSFADNKAALAALGDADPHTVRAAVGRLADHPHPDLILPLAKFIPSITTEDTHLRHAARIALRNALTAPDSQEKLVWILKDRIKETRATESVFDDVFLGVPTAYAGWWLSERLREQTITSDLAERAAEHVGKAGCNYHRLVIWNKYIGRPSHDRSVSILFSLEKGAKSSGYASLAEATRFEIMPNTSMVIRDPKNELQDLARNLKTAEPKKITNVIRYAQMRGIDISDEVAPIAKDPKAGLDSRLECIEYLVRNNINQPKNHVFPVARSIFMDASAPANLREKAIAILSRSQDAGDQDKLRAIIATAPYRESVFIANGMATSVASANELFKLIRMTKASPRLLQEKSILDRLKTTNPPGWEATVKELTAGIPSADARLAALIKQRSEGYGRAKKDVEAGKKVFATTCANCHQVGGQGAKIGPQLDGIGNRGVERLLEDTLDPNRNVDHAFHTTILELKDGGQLTGLLRVEGKTLIMVDTQAKETRVNLDDVEKKRTTPVSPMPSDIAEKLKPQDFYNLIAYLADLRAK